MQCMWVHIKVNYFAFIEGADLRAVLSLDRNALHCACESGDVATIELFLDKGFKIDCVDKEGSTPLLLAARKGHANTVTFLLSKGNGFI